MDPIRFSIDKPVTVSVGVILVVLFGILALGAIPIQLTPNVETTVVSVTTRWEGASPADVEREIIQEQEEKLKGMSALRKMFSECKLGEGVITLEFAQGTTKEAALRETSDKLREVEDYPENVDEPVVEARNPQDRDYIAWVVISSTDPEVDIRTFQDFFEEQVKPEIERVEGISEVNVIGGWEREVHVRIDPQRLALRGVTPTELVESLRLQNRNASAGQLAEGKLDVRVRSIGRYERLDQIEDTLLSKPGEPVVRVKDVGEAVMGHKEPDRTVRNKGRTVIAMNAQREVGSNVIEVMKGFKARLEDVRANHLPAEEKRVGMNGHVVMEQVYDQTTYIYQALNLVVDNLYVGGALAVGVLLLFLRSLRSTLIIALAIPVSVIGTFLAMKMMGRTINVISLAGLAFAVGMVVDNAIVVLENIDRHRRMDPTSGSAAYRGAREVWGAVLASTLTTLCVFIPIVFMQEESGQLFRDISLAVCASVLLSLIVSVTVIPAACAAWMKPRTRPGQNNGEGQSGNGGVIDRAAAAMTASFSRFMEWLSRTWLLRIAVILLLTVVSIVGSYLLMPPSSYLPAGNRNLVFAMMFTPPGYNIQQQESIGHRIEDQLRVFWQACDDPALEASLPAVPSIDPFTGLPTTIVPSPMDNFFFVAVPDMMFMGGISADPMRVGPTEDLLNHAIGGMPGVRGFANQLPLFRTASRGSADAMELEVAGPDLDQVNRVASLLHQRYAQKYGYPRVRPNPINFDLPGPEVRVERIPVVATDLGVTQQDINTAVQIFGDGAIVGDFVDRGDIIDLKVISATNDHGDAMYLANVPIASAGGRVVPLSSVATVTRAVAPQTISRSEEQRAVTLEISLPDQMPLEQAMTEIRLDIAELRAAGRIPSNVSTNLAGSAAKLGETKEALLGQWTGFNRESLSSLLSSRMFIAVVVVFLLMASLFESWAYPFVIMFSVPLATVGGFLGLRLVHTYVPDQQLDVLTMLGFVILVGVVVNNAILIVHQALNFMRGVADTQPAGHTGEPIRMEPRAAIAESVRTRIRPIMMSTLTSVGGMMPLVLFPGAGSELYRGLGSVVVGGLMVSTLFTLVLVPLMLSIVFDLRAAALTAANKARGLVGQTT